LPLALWNFGAFFWSVVWFQFLQPFRPDALSIPAWLVSLGFPQPPAWPAFVALVVAGVFLLKRLRPSTAGFAASLAVIFMVFFSLNRQAFLNYYFLVGACLCSAIAASDVKDGLDPGNLVGEETVAKKACESGA
jgi:asparagine N-glycosylation enzyme membrane subunit Stt3